MLTLHDIDGVETAIKLPAWPGKYEEAVKTLLAGEAAPGEKAQGGYLCL